jgi:hypothetical protein
MLIHYIVQKIVMGHKKWATIAYIHPVLRLKKKVLVQVTQIFIQMKNLILILLNVSKNQNLSILGNF